MTSEIEEPRILIDLEKKKSVMLHMHERTLVVSALLAGIMGSRGTTEQGSPCRERDGDGAAICTVLILFTIISPFFKTYFACKHVCLAFILATYVALFEPRAH